jgi:thiosulfate dehydrogenase
MNWGHRIGLFVLLATPLLGIASGTDANAASAAAWPQADADKLPTGAWKDAVLYGRKLVQDTDAIIGPHAPKKAMRFSGNNLSCQNCHLDGGTRKFGLPFVGIYGLFPAYMAREDKVRTLEDRIEGCMERSMNGRALPSGGREITALVSYIKFLSSSVPIGEQLPGRATPPLGLLSRAADPKRGGHVYEIHCASCHQPDGSGERNRAPGQTGGYTYPPLWGPDSFNDGAGMHRLITSASFVHANMPFGASYSAPILSAEDAWDVAAFINSKPRPKRAGLAADYPDRRRKPADAPFPPFADHFPLAQHRLGPYQPIIDAQKKASGTAY